MAGSESANDHQSPAVDPSVLGIHGMVTFKAGCILRTCDGITLGPRFEVHQLWIVPFLRVLLKHAGSIEPGTKADQASLPSRSSGKVRWASDLVLRIVWVFWVTYENALCMQDGWEYRNTMLWKAICKSSTLLTRRGIVMLRKSWPQNIPKYNWRQSTLASYVSCLTLGQPTPQTVWNFHCELQTDTVNQQEALTQSQI